MTDKNTELRDESPLKTNYVHIDELSHYFTEIWQIIEYIKTIPDRRELELRLHNTINEGYELTKTK